jgi:hypothetical protein
LLDYHYQGLTPVKPHRQNCPNWRFRGGRDVEWRTSFIGPLMRAPRLRVVKCKRYFTTRRILDMQSNFFRSLSSARLSARSVASNAEVCFAPHDRTSPAWPRMSETRQWQSFLMNQTATPEGAPGLRIRRPLEVRAISVLIESKPGSTLLL